jgi:hypothetical protein
MDHGSEAGVGFVAAHGDAFELLDLAEEILDEMTPFVHFGVDGKRFCASRMLGYDDHRAAFVEFKDKPVRIEGLVRDEGGKGNAVKQRRDTDRIVALARQQYEPNQIAERIGKRQDFRCQTALGLAYSLALSPPFAPCPWRWTLTMVASTIAYSMSGSPDTALKIFSKTPALTQ